MWFTSRRGVAAVAGVMILLTGLGASTSSADPADPLDYTPWPGLPTARDLDPTRPGFADFAVPFSWGGIAMTGRAGSVPAKQWTHIPVTLLAIQYFFDPDPPTPPLPQLSRFSVSTWSFFVSPKRSEENYGNSAPITVRTVAFGSIPVEVKLQVVQQRTDSGTPKPIAFDSFNGNIFVAGEQGLEYAESAPLNDAVFTRVSDIKVDGVDLALGSTCQTANPGALKFAGTYKQGPPVLQGNYDPGGDEDLLLGVAGGNLSGTVDIGRFANCRTKSGDDISPLLTSAISGPANPLRIRIGVINCLTYTDDFAGFLPPPTGAATPEEGYCQAISPDPTNPAFPKYVTIPKAMDLPDYAPGEQPTP